MADSEKTQTDKDVAREEIDHTVVMEDGPKAMSGNRSGTHLSDVIDNAPAAIGIDSIIFASDYPYESLADMMKFMDSLDLSPEDQEKVFHLNAEKYLL